jgi:hypothetical protein
LPAHSEPQPTALCPSAPPRIACSLATAAATTHPPSTTTPKQAQNTERGSAVGRGKRERSAAWRQLLVDKIAAPALSLRALARVAQLSHTAVEKRWKAYEAARAAGKSEQAALDDAASDKRGGSNRAFTAQHEQLLADIVRAAKPSMTHTQIQDEALRFKRDVDVAAGAHDTRSQPLFRASDHFVSGFKRRQRLSSHRTAVVHESRVDPNRDQELEHLAFVLEVRDAIHEYGAGMVLNMDETPVTLLDAPVTAVVTTGTKEAAKIMTPVNVGTKITTIPTITAAGERLPMCAVLKGKTQRCLNKVKNDASAAVKKVQLYYSEKGWINEGIMALYFRDVVLPHTHAQPAALILDSYRAHFTPAVREAAEAMELKLIQVPAGATSILQPLDVSFNGPLLMKRKQLWAEKKLKNPFAEDSIQAAIERAQQAYDAMPNSLALTAFANTFLLD